MTRILTIIALLFATPAWADNLIKNASIPLSCDDIPRIKLASPEICFAEKVVGKKIRRLSDGKHYFQQVWLEYSYTGLLRVFERHDDGSFIAQPVQALAAQSKSATWYLDLLPDGSMNSSFIFGPDFKEGWNINKERIFLVQKWENDSFMQKLSFSPNQLKIWAEELDSEQSLKDVDKFLSLFSEDSNFRYYRHEGRTVLAPLKGDLNASWNLTSGTFGYVGFAGEASTLCGGETLVAYYGKLAQNYMPLNNVKSVSYCFNGQREKRVSGIYGMFKGLEKAFNAVLEIAKVKSDLHYKQFLSEKAQLEYFLAKRDSLAKAEINIRVSELRQAASNKERQRLAEKERLRLEAAEAERRRLAEKERLRKAAEKAAKLARDRKLAPLRAKCDGFGYNRETPQFNQCVSDQEALLELREVTISKRQEERELERLEEQRQEEAKIEQLKAIERATRETGARIALAQKQANRQAEEQRRMQASQNLMNLGLSIMNGGLGNQGYSAAPAPRTGTTGCFLQGSRVSGFNRICTYNCTGSQLSDTIASTSICPLRRN